MTNKNFLRPLLVITALAASFLTSPLRAAVGDIYETNEGNVLRFKPIGGQPGSFVTGFSNPKGLVFDGNGRLYVADPGKAAVLVFTIDGVGSTYLSALNGPTGLAIDSTGNLYVSESGSGNILKFDSERNKTTFASNTAASAGLAFDAQGNLYSADFNGGKIYKFSPDGVTKTTFASGLSFPAGLAFDSAGNLFVAESEAGNISKIAPDGTKSSFVTGLGRPYGIAFETSGNLIVADNARGATTRITPTGTKTALFQSDFNTPQFVAIEPAQHTLLNLSTRGFVQGGNDVLIAGFVVGGSGPVGTKILIRALGPSLSAFGIPNPLPDPVLELRDASGTLLASNNNWSDTQQSALTGINVNPSDDRESAILTNLKGGAFTAIVGSATGESGVSVVEVYNLP